MKSSIWALRNFGIAHLGNEEVEMLKFDVCLFLRMKSSILALQHFVMAHFGKGEVEMIEFDVCAF